MPSQTQQTYRYDLDGLRGLAIAGVVAFHVYVGRVSGGVDVFLALSGFFFLGSQLRNASRINQSINPWWSIWRTLRRLYPSLILTIVSTLLLVYWLTPGLVTASNVRQLAASVFYYQNYELARQGQDYAAATTLASPLQHLWSMSAQAQFYLGAIIIVTLLAWALRRTRFFLPTAGLVIMAVTIGSFARACYLHSVSQPLNYYATSSRLWELTLGAGIGLALPFVSIPRLLGKVLAPLGLAMILSTGFIVDGAATFPGPWALWPIAGTAMVIACGQQAPIIQAVLSSKPMTFLGGIAYSLYLWHWPLLIIATVYFDQSKPSAILGTGVIAVSVILAWLTNRFVEKPLQQSRRRPTTIEPVVMNARRQLRRSHVARAKAFAGVITVAGAVFAASTVPWYNTQVKATINSRLPISQYPGALAVTNDARVPEVANYGPNPRLITELWPQPAVDGCLTMGDEEADKIVTTRRWTDDTPCSYGDTKSNRTMMLIGGSHSEHWFSPLNSTAKSLGYQLDVVLRQGCPPTLEPIEGIGDICVDWTKAVLKKIAKDKPDVIVTTATRPGQGDSHANDRTDYTPNGYSEFWDAVSEMGIKIVAIRDTPWAWNEEDELFSPTACVVGAGAISSRASKKIPEKCNIKRDRVMSPENAAKEFFDKEPQRKLLDFTDTLCDENVCPPVIGNVYVYRDSNHITDEIAASLSEEMRRQLARFLQ